MKILHVIRGLTNSSGTTHIVIPLAEEQARQGHNVTVWHVAKPGEPSLAPDAPLVSSRCFPMSWPPTRHLGWSRPFIREIHGHVAAFDVVHTHAIWNLVTTAALRAATHAGVPIVVAPQGSCDPVAWRIGSPLRRAYASCIELPLLRRRATRMQALTETEVHQIRSMGIRTPCSILPNGVRADLLSPPAERDSRLRGRLGLPAEETLLLHLGRVHPKKGVDLLIRAIGVLRKNGIPVTLIVAGTDAGSGYGSELEGLAAELATGGVRFLGEVKGERKLEALWGADLFALASRSEGQPIAVLEAMAAGLPVLASNACHLPIIQKADAGVIVPTNVTGIVNALMPLLSDPARRQRLAANGTKLARTHFDWAEVARKSIDMYTAAISSDRTTAR